MFGGMTSLPLSPSISNQMKHLHWPAQVQRIGKHGRAGSQARVQRLGSWTDLTQRLPVQWRLQVQSTALSQSPSLPCLKVGLLPWSQLRSAQYCPIRGGTGTGPDHANAVQRDVCLTPCAALCPHSLVCSTSSPQRQALCPHSLVCSPSSPQRQA